MIFFSKNSTNNCRLNKYNFPTSCTRSIWLHTEMSFTPMSSFRIVSIAMFIINIASIHDIILRFNYKSIVCTPKFITIFFNFPGFFIELIFFSNSSRSLNAVSRYCLQLVNSKTFAMCSKIVDK